jgi:hypothetical protein
VTMREGQELRGFVLATGFSGHGFAMGPSPDASSPSSSWFRFSRFAEGAVGKPRNVL